MIAAVQQLRVVVITPRFWPQTGSSASVASNLAVTLRTQGAHPRIVTPLWFPDWPKTVVHREIPVDRLTRSGSRFYGRQRYSQALLQWLRQLAGEYDAIFAVALDEFVEETLLSPDRCNVPILVRVNCRDLKRFDAGVVNQKSGRRWWSNLEMNRNRFFFTSYPGIADTLCQLGIPREQMRIRPNCVPHVDQRTAADRFAAREALAAINHDLAVTEYAPVGLYVGRIELEKGLHELIQAWVPIAQGVPSSALWLIGDGPARKKLYQLAVDLGVHHQVRMPGTFDEMTGVYQAADFFVNPSPAESTNLATLEAMAAGLPIVAANTSSHRLYLNQGRCGLLVRPLEVAAWTAQMQFLIDSPGPARELGQLAREFSRQNFCMNYYTSDVLAMIESLRR